MQNSLLLLVGTAATIAFIHTVLGPDHYLPFIALSRARDWSMRRTFTITLLCGIGHVLSSIVLGLVGIALGVALFRLEAIEAFRGDIAAWFLLVFGFTYFVWGLHRALRGRSREHAHEIDGAAEVHTHFHLGRHSHEAGSKGLTPWVLFLIFVFGPCEPLIPLVMFPAARGNALHVVAVSVVFGVVTVGTMLGLVMAASRGIAAVPADRFGNARRYGHALAGLVVLACGGAITFLGL